MTAKQLREKALKAVQAARALKEEHGLEMSADVQEQFDAHLNEAAEAHSACEVAAKKEEAFAKVEELHELYTRPSNSIIVSGAPGLSAPAQSETLSAEDVNKARREAFGRYIAFGERGLTAKERTRYQGSMDGVEGLADMSNDERWALLSSVDNLGGFTVQDDFMSELIKLLAGQTVIRPIARVRSTVSNPAVFLSINGPAAGNRQYSSGVTGNFRSEGWLQGGQNPPTQNEPNFGRERITIYSWIPDVIEIGAELLEDSSINLISEVATLLAEVRAMDEDSVFILGTGIGMPTGVVHEANQGNLVTVNSGAANGQSYAGLVNLWEALAAQYRGRAVWLMNSITLAALMLLEDTAGNSIFPINTVPTQLFGRPILVSDFMPDGSGAGTDGNHGIIFGDFNYYAIADRKSMEIGRLTETFWPNIGLVAMGRLGGQMLKTEPFVAQTTGA